MADFVSDKEFVPDSRATADKAAAGFVPDSDFVSDEQKYGEGAIPALKAFGLGAARSASFGLSDEALVRLGALNPEELSAYKEHQPVATGAGEVGGVLGAVLAPEAGVLGALSAPVKAVARAGGAITEAAAPIAEGLVGSIASEATSPVINKILSQAGAHAVGSAVEGAAYGLGQSVTEHALGDPDLNGEKVLANAGTTALIGGALGSIFGAAKGGLQAKFPKFLSQADKEAIHSGDFKAMAEASDMPEAQKQGFIDGLTKQRADAGEIKEAAAAIDAPVLPGMISDSEAVRKGQSALLEGPPSFPALKAQQMAAQGFEKAGSAVENTLGAETDITKASLGDTLKDVVSQSVEKQAEPINALYDELKSRYQTIPTSEKALKQIADNIRKIEDVPLSPQARAIAESAAERVESIKTVDDVKRLRSILNQELGLSATPIQKRVTAIIADKLGNLEESSIVRFAENEMKTSVAKDKIMSLLDQREATNAQYSVFKDKIQRLGEVMGRKRVHGAQDFLDFVESMTPEKIADKLAGKNNSEFLGWFSKEFPEGMQSIAQYQKGLIRSAAMKDGEFNIRRALTEIDKLPKEYQSKIFNEDELKKLGFVRKYVQAFPKNFNPSNTANASAFRHFFEGPIAALTGNMRDIAIEKFINAATSSGDQTKAFIDGLTTIEKNAAKTSKSIASGVSSIFSTKDSGSPAKGYLAISSQERREKHDELHPELSEMTASPEKLIDHLSKNTEALNEIAPKTSEAVQGAMARATQFLQSKLPQGGPQKPLSPKYKPSDAELAKWHKYFSAVESPTEVLHDVARGTLVPETMEALSVVYPKMLSEMQMAVTDKMTDAISKKKIIPYRTKLALSLFLGSDMVNSLDPKSMLANQNMLATATMTHSAQTAGQMSGVNNKSLGKIDKAHSYMTSMQQSAQREDA